MEERYPTKLTKGSRYRLTILTGNGQSMTVEGEFMGYVQYGNDMGIGLVMDEGRMRIVPSRVVAFIDVLDMKEEEEEKSKDGGVYFG